MYIDVWHNDFRIKDRTGTTQEIRIPMSHLKSMALHADNLTKSGNLPSTKFWPYHTPLQATEWKSQLQLQPERWMHTCHGSYILSDYVETVSVWSADNLPLLSGAGELWTWASFTAEWLPGASSSSSELSSSDCPEGDAYIKFSSASPQPPSSIEGQVMLPSSWTDSCCSNLFLNLSSGVLSGKFPSRILWQQLRHSLKGHAGQHLRNWLAENLQLLLLSK